MATKDPAGPKRPQGWHVKDEEDQNQGLDLETAARHQSRGRYGATQDPLWQEPPCWGQRCAVTKLERAAGEEEGWDRTVEWADAGFKHLMCEKDEEGKSARIVSSAMRNGCRGNVAK